MKSFSMSFEIHNTERLPRTFTIKTEVGKLAELRPLLKQLGRDIPTETGKATQVGFIKALNICDSGETPQPNVDRIEVAGGAHTGLTLTGELEGNATLLHVIQEVDGKKVGGLSVLVVQGKEQKKERA
jgi:hypothetical protein